VPLIKSPSYQPPKPITLNTNYEKLIPTLYKSVIPPKISLSDKDVLIWLDEMNSWKEEISQSLSKDDAFKTWLNKQQLSTAPGFNFSIMKPAKIDHNKLDDINELDQVFGKAKIIDNV
jgi:hypothetical protein